MIQFLAELEDVPRRQERLSQVGEPWHRSGLLDVCLHRAEDVVVRIDLAGNAFGPHLHVRHVSTHEVEVPDVLHGCVVPTHVVPHFRARSIEIDPPAGIVVETFVELVPGKRREDP